MNYQQALKEVQAKKQKDCFIRLEMSYGLKLLMTHKAGMAFLETLINAEKFDETHSEEPSIKPLESSDIRVCFMSSEDYERYKVAALLGVSYSAMEGVEKQKT
jgi:hypothetical protein